MMSRKKKITVQVLALVMVFSVCFFAGKVLAEWGKPEDSVVKNIDKNTSGKQEDELSVDRLNVLLLGVDARPGEKDARSDSMIVVSIDRDTKKIAMISIPRDTLVNIKGHGEDKINAANQIGGADLARSTVEDLLGIEIPYYVKTNFNGFKDIVDTLGGVELDVEKRMYYPSEGINLKPGVQELNGSKALAYVRFRHDALGDIARTERQQKFLTALAKETMQASTIIKLPKLVPQLMDAVETNLGVRDAIFLAGVTSKLNSDNIVTATLPGVFYNYKGISYWKADDNKTKIVLNDLFSGTKVATISGPDVNVPKTSTKTTTKTTKPVVQETTKTPPKEPVKVPDNNGDNNTNSPDENGSQTPEQNQGQNNQQNNGQNTGNTGQNNNGSQSPSGGQNTGTGDNQNNNTNQNGTGGNGTGTGSGTGTVVNPPQTPGNPTGSSQNSGNGLNGNNALNTGINSGQQQS